MHYPPQAKRKSTLSVAEYWVGVQSGEQVGQLSVRETAAATYSADPKASKLYYVLLHWIHKWAQQNDKSQYHSCMNATAKQDEKLFDTQNTIDGAYKKEAALVQDFLTVHLNCGAGSRTKRKRQNQLRSCSEIPGMSFSHAQKHHYK